MSEGVSGKSGRASATGQVTDHLAIGVLATGSGTGVLAFHAYAGQIGEAIGTEGTLGTASFVRVSEIVWQALARTHAVLLFANGIRSAGGWRTGAKYLDWVLGRS